MDKEKKISEEVEKTLCAFDNDNILEANPFLITRINAEIAERMKQRKKVFSFNIGMSQALMILVFLINLITLVYFYDKSEKQNLQEKLVTQLKEEFQFDQSQNTF
jgi:hypothetical protein